MTEAVTRRYYQALLTRDAEYDTAAILAEEMVKGRFTCVIH